MEKSQDTFGRAVAAQTMFPLSGNILAMVSVSNFLVQFGRNPVGKHGFLSVSPL